LRDISGSFKGTPTTQQDEFDDVANWTNKIHQLIETVEEEMDPIDVAFYRPHIKNAAQKCYKRATISLGFLVQLNNLHVDFKPKTSSGVQEQHNVLVVAPLFTRFSLLPISTPPMKLPAPSSVPSVTEQDMLSQHSTSNALYSNAQSFYANNTAVIPEKVPIPGKQSLVGKIGSMFTNTSSTVPEKKDKGKSGDSLWFL